MRFIQCLVSGEAHEEKLSGAVFGDRALFGAHHHLGGCGVWVVRRFHCVRQIFLEETPEDFGVQIRDRADDEKDLHPVNRNERVERIANRQRVNKAEDEKDADVFLEVLPAFVSPAGQFVQIGNARRQAD